MTRERILHWLYIALYVGAIVIVARLVFNGAWDKGVHWVDKVGLVVIALAAFVILKRINPDLRGLLSGNVGALADRKTSEIAANLFLTVLGIMASAVGLMAPRPATELKPGYIQKTVTNIWETLQRVDANTQKTKEDAELMKKQLDRITPKSDTALMDHIKGIWGEDDCKVTYRYTFADGVKRPGFSGGCLV